MTTALGLLVYELKVAFNADYCFITRWDDKNGAAIPLVGSGKWGNAYRSIVFREGETTLTASLMREGKIIAIEDALDSPYISPRIARYFGESSLHLLYMGRLRRSAALQEASREVPALSGTG